MNWIVILALSLALFVFAGLLWLTKAGFAKTFGLRSLSRLSQNWMFYVNKRNDTLKYLKAVYPVNNFDSLTSLELAAFYNSLWFYYNCAGEYNGGILCWQRLPDCGTEKMPPLPYTPQGWLYSFADWVDGSWTPFIYSDSSINPKHIVGSTPGETFGSSGFFYYNGPADVWMFQRAIFRMIYNPVLHKVPGDERIITVGLPIKGDLDSMRPRWNYPHEWWKGVPDNGWMEVTAASEPGMPGSPPLLWYDGWIGSGVFLNVGKSHRARNKGHCCLTLAKQMTATPQGQAKLIEWFGSADPYEVVKNVGFRGSAESGWTVCNVPPKATKTEVNTRGPVIAKGDGGTIKCNLCNNSWRQATSIPDTPKGWADVQTDSIPNWTLWCKDVDANGEPVLTNECIDALVSGHDYRSDRYHNDISWDEPNFLMGIWLGYDTIQNTNSANGNGFWQYEIMDLRGYPEKAKNRDYSDFIMLPADSSGKVSCDDPTTITSRLQYIPSFTKTFMNTIPAQTLSIRDPLNLNNSKECVVPPYPPPAGQAVNYGTDINITCEGTLSSTMFKNLSVVNCTPSCNSAKLPLCLPPEAKRGVNASLMVSNLSQ